MDAVCLILKMRMDVLWYLYNSTKDENLKSKYLEDCFSKMDEYFKELNEIADSLLGQTKGLN